MKAPWSATARQRRQAGQGSWWSGLPGVVYLIALVFLPLVLIFIYSSKLEDNWNAGTRHLLGGVSGPLQGFLELRAQAC